MKKLIKLAIVLMAVFSATSSSAAGLGTLGIFNHLGVGAHAATTGFGFEVATPITKFITLRAGASFMPGFSFNTDVDGTYHTGVNDYSEDFTMNIKGALKRTQGSVIFNIYPVPMLSSFYVAAGAYFGGNDIVKISGHSDELEGLINSNPTIEIGDYQLPVDQHGNVNGSLKVKKFRPYLGLGFGRAIPKRLLSFGVEFGVQFMGKMKVYSGNEELNALITENDDDWQKVIDKLTVYPVIKFTLSGKIF